MLTIIMIAASKTFRRQAINKPKRTSTLTSTGTFHFGEYPREHKLVVTATFIKDEGEKVFFTTTATEADGVLILDDCTSDYYYDPVEEMIRFTFHGFQNNLPSIYFKSIYTINLGMDYSYLTAYTCTKR